MGRKKLNRTIEELREQKRIRDERYYNRHKTQICEKRMQKYWETMVPKLPDL